MTNTNQVPEPITYRMIGEILREIAVILLGILGSVIAIIFLGILVAKFFWLAFIILLILLLFRPNNLPNLEHLNDTVRTIFLLRVPIISGLILICFPLIAQLTPASQFLQNLFVLDTGMQLIMVIIAATSAAITIVSLTKSILVVDNPERNYNNRLRVRRTIWTLLLFLPTWIILFWNNNESKINLIYFAIGALISILIFLVVQFYDYDRNIDQLKPNLPSSLQGVITSGQKVTTFPKEFIEEKRPNKTQPFEPKDYRRFYVLVQSLIGFTAYIILIGLNWPNPSGNILIPLDYQAPTLLYALVIIWVITQVIGYLIYHFDRSSKQSNNFRWPAILLLIIFSACGYAAFGVDHYFQLKDSEEIITQDNYPQDFKEAMAKRFAKQGDGDKTLVVVAASGGGIQASGWTAQVLAGLQDEIGERFTQSIGIISSASGGSVGTMFYLDNINKEGILSDPQAMCENATDDWLDSVGWGLAFPDLVRVIGFPFVNRDQYIDRGYALEKDWERKLNSSQLTLDDWYNRILDGEIPIPVFNSTLVENGRRFLISPMKFLPRQMSDYLEAKPNLNLPKALDFRTLYNCGKPDEFKVCNLDIMTAARLSATFPYVSPMARNDRENEIAITIKNPQTNKDEKVISVQNYHMADGGYFDNAGAFTAIEWLNNFLKYKDQSLNITKVILLQINAFPEEPIKLQQQGDKGFATVLLGPLTALNGVRNSTQIERNIQAEDLLIDNLAQKIKIKRFDISFPKKDPEGNLYNQPLSWRLTQQQKENLINAWKTDKTIRRTVTQIKQFWDEDKEQNSESPTLT